MNNKREAVRRYVNLPVRTAGVEPSKAQVVLRPSQTPVTRGAGLGPGHARHRDQSEATSAPGLTKTGNDLTYNAEPRSAYCNSQSDPFLP